MSQVIPGRGAELLYEFTAFNLARSLSKVILHSRPTNRMTRRLRCEEASHRAPSEAKGQVDKDETEKRGRQWLPTTNTLIFNEQTKVNDHGQHASRARASAPS